MTPIAAQTVVVAGGGIGGGGAAHPPPPARREGHATTGTTYPGRSCAGDRERSAAALSHG